MPRFKVRDLMIHLPDEQQPAQQACVHLSVAGQLNQTLCITGTCFTGTCFTGTCYTGTCFTGTCYTGTCFTATCHTITLDQCHTITKIPCGLGSACGVSVIDPTTPIRDPIHDVTQVADLETLREQLKGALAHVEEQVRLRDEQMAPRTAEEFDALEQQLKGALEELQARRANLKQ